jgi:hypothetical protein
MSLYYPIRKRHRIVEKQGEEEAGKKKADDAKRG